MLFSLNRRRHAIANPGRYPGFAILSWNCAPVVDPHFQRLSTILRNCYNCLTTEGHRLSPTNAHRGLQVFGELNPGFVFKTDINRLLRHTMSRQYFETNGGGGGAGGGGGGGPRDTVAETRTRSLVSSATSGRGAFQGDGVTPWRMDSMTLKPSGGNCVLLCRE